MDAERSGRKVRNRDIPLLNRIFYIMQDIRSMDRRCEFTREQMYSTTKRMTGMPGGGPPRGYDLMLGELEELNRDYGEKVAEYARELKKAERILNGIPSPKARTFVRMYYVDAVKTSEILSELDLTEYKFKQALERIEGAERMAKVDWPDEYVAE